MDAVNHGSRLQTLSLAPGIPILEFDHTALHLERVANLV